MKHFLIAFYVSMLSAFSSLLVTMISELIAAKSLHAVIFDSTDFAVNEITTV